MLKKINVSLLSLIYICFMIVYMAIREVLPLNFLIENSLVSAAVFMPGFLLLLLDLFTAKKCINGRTQDLLLLFLVVCGVSSLINARFGLFGNIKCMAALLIEYFVFFCYAKNMPADQIKKSLNVISITLIITWFVLVFASLLTYFFGVDISVSHYGAFSITSQGFSFEYARLWGLFQDPNYASIICLVSILASVRLIAQKKKLILSILLGINIISQVFYIILGGSRAALILTIAAAFLYALYKFILSPERANAKETVKRIAAAVVCFAVCVGLLFGSKAALPHIKTTLIPDNKTLAVGIGSGFDKLYSLSDLTFELTQRNNRGELVFSTSPDATVDPIVPDTQNPIDRTDLGKDDISNGRFKRWLQTLDIFLQTPLFGTSPRNLAAFAEVYNPETLMAKYDMAPHNGYLDVLVSTGIIGFAVLAAAILFALFGILKRFLANGFSQERAMLLLSVIVFAGVAMFISDIYMTFSINSMFFWLFLGTAYHLDNDQPAGGIVWTVFHKFFSKKESL